MLVYRKMSALLIFSKIFDAFCLANILQLQKYLAFIFKMRVISAKGNRVVQIEVTQMFYKNQPHENATLSFSVFFNDFHQNLYERTTFV